jgi:predicted small secreted protein
MRGLTLLLVGGLVLALGACNTIAGIGKDLQGAGRAIERSAK